MAKEGHKQVPEFDRIPEISLLDKIHVVSVGDTTEDPTGSSFHALIGEVSGGPGSVIALGADPTGVEDSTAAFQLAQATGVPFVPNGRYRIDGTIVCDDEAVWVFERGLLPQFNHWINPVNWLHDDTPGRGVTLFKDNSSSNVPFFKIRSQWVSILGYPRCDINLRTETYNSGIVEYAAGETNLAGDPNSRTSMWGGDIELIVTGNYATLATEGNGAKCIHVTWASETTFAYVVKQNWRVYAFNVAYGFYLEPRVDSTSYANNIDGYFDGHRVKQGVYNACATGCKWRVRIQNAGCMPRAEAPRAAVEVTPAAFGNIIDAAVFDPSAELVADGNGEYGISYLVQNDARNTQVLRSQSLADTEVANQVPTGIQIGLYAPIGIVPFGTRDAGVGLNTLYISALNNNFANAALKATTFTYDVYDGTAVADSDTAVSDAVFSNQSGASVDITSALGSLPTMVVGAIFTVSDHDAETYNNGGYKVTAVITNGYTCSKQGDTVTASDANYNLAEPANASAEAITVTTGIAALMSDSVTESIATSAEWTEVTSLSTITKSYGTAPVASLTQNAIDDVDYLEFHFDGYSYNAQRMYIAISGNGGFTKVQLIRKSSGTVVDNCIIDGAESGDQEQAGLDRLFITGGTADETIIRLIGPRNTKAMVFEDIATTPSNRSAEGHFVSQLGGHDMLGDLNFTQGSSPILDTATTAQLEDVTDAVNTRAAKVVYSQIVNTTTGAVVYAAGAANGDVWKNFDGSTAHTPV